MREPSRAQCLILTPSLPAGQTWNPPIADPRLIRDSRPSEGLAPKPVVEEPSQSRRALQLAATRYANVIAELLDGRRSLGQLEAWFDPGSLARLRERCRSLHGRRVRLASVRVQAVGDQAGEVTLRLTTAERDHVAALRVVGSGERWLASDLVIP